MTAESVNQMLSHSGSTFTKHPMTEPAEVQRTPAEKARILARLTLALAAIEKEEGRTHGDA